MSQQNVELHYRVYEAFNRRDLGAILALMDEDVEAESVIVRVEGRYHGHERIRRLWKDLLDVWPDLTARAVEVRDLGDVTVADLRLHGRGAGSDIPTDERLWVVVRWRRGKCVGWSDFYTCDEALEAAGLQEQTMSQENEIRAGYKAWSDGDLDAFLETLDPEIELLTSGSFPDFAPVYRGYDGMRNFWDAIRAPWEWFQLDVERIVEGADCAAVAVHFRVRGRGSGVSTDLQQGHALWFRHGRTVKVSTHQSFEQALEAAGLTE